MNHWDDTKLVPVYDMEKLPNGIREQKQFGLKTINSADYERNSDIPKTVSLDTIRSKYYIVVREPSEGRRGKKDLSLSRVIVHNDNSVTLQRVQKLGKQGKHGQVLVHYNPDISYHDFEVNEVIRTDNGYTGEDGALDPSDINAGLVRNTSEGTGVDEAFEGLIRKREQSESTSDSEVVGFEDVVRHPARHAEAVSSVKQLRKEVEDADKKNEELLVQYDVDDLSANFGTDTYTDDDEDVRDITTWMLGDPLGT
jgi:hypothetical protein